MKDNSKTKKIGLPKSKIPKNIEGIVRFGKIKTVIDGFFSVNTKHQGTYIFLKEEASKFKLPRENQKVYMSFIGSGKYLYFVDKVFSEKWETIYQRKY